MGAGREDRDGGEPTPDQVRLLKVTNAVERADEDLLQEIRHVALGFQRGAQDLVHVGTVLVVEGRGGAGMAGPEGLHERAVISDKRQGSNHRLLAMNNTFRRHLSPEPEWGCFEPQ